MEKRTIADVQAIFDLIEGADPQVLTDDQKYIDFTKEGGGTIGSSAFEGCNGLLIATERGALLGHYTQTTDGLNQANANFIPLYQTNKDDLADAAVYLYSYTDINGVLKEPDNVNSMKKLLSDLTGTEPQLVTYINPVDVFMDDEAALEAAIDAEDDRFAPGAIAVTNAGGGNSETVVRWITTDLQKQNTQPPS